MSWKALYLTLKELVIGIFVIAIFVLVFIGPIFLANHFLEGVGIIGGFIPIFLAMIYFLYKNKVKELSTEKKK